MIPEPAAHDGVAADPRKGVEESFCLDRTGHHEEAAAVIDELAAKHPDHKMVLFQAGRVHLFAGTRSAKAQPRRGEEMEHHLLRARGYFAEAKRLCPNCIDISLALAETLYESWMHDETDEELQRGLGIESPVDPAESNIAHSIGLGRHKTRDQRVMFVTESAFSFSRVFEESVCNDHVPRVIREVLELDADDHHGVVKALRIATDLAKRYHYSSRAQHIRAYMRLRFARSLDATIDRRQFVWGILTDMNVATMKFSRSIVLAMFQAKLCFVMGLFEIAEIAVRQALTVVEPVDPNLEDIPPGSVKGEGYGDRIYYVYKELERLQKRIVFVTGNYWYSMTSEKQDSFLSVRLDELHEYYDDYFESGHWGARTIADALRFIKKTRSCRVWICPFCVDKKLQDTPSLLQHMCRKHPAEKVLLKLKFVLVPKQSDDTSDDDYMLKDISVCQDSDGSYVFHFKNRDYIFEDLFTFPCFDIRGKSFAEVRDDKRKAGSLALQKLKNLPEEKSSMKFSNARPEIEDLWQKFVKASALDYRVAICPLVKTRIWTNLIKCMKEDNGASKIITNADIDEVFPNVLDVPGSASGVEHGTKPSNEIKEQRSGDDQQTMNTKPSCSDVTLKMDEEHKRSVVAVLGSSATPENGPKPSNGLKDHKSVDNQQTMNFKSLCSDVTLKMDEEHKRSEVHVEDEYYDAMVNGKPSEAPIKINGYGSKLNATPENVGEDLKYEVHVEDKNFGAMVNGKPSEEPIKINGYGSKLNATPENVGEDLKYEVHVKDDDSDAMVNGKPSEEPIKINGYGSKLNATPENVGEDLKYEVHVEDKNFGAMVNGKPSEEPIKINGYGSKVNATTENVGEDLKYEVHVEDMNFSAMVNGKPSEEPIEMNEYGSKLNATPENVGAGTSDQPAEEMPIVCRYKKNVDVLKKCNAHEDLFFLNIIVQSLWNLRCFCNEILRRPPACFHLLHDCPCIAGKLYEIFFALEKSGHFRMPPLLTDVKTTLCEIIHDTEMFCEMQAGRITFSRIQVGRNFASEIMAMIIEGLHKSETCLHLSSYGTSENAVIDPASCTNFVCRAHDLFGITLKQLMSCNCGESFSEEYTSIFHVLDASSLYTTKINSIAQLPVLMDQQLNREIKCNKCTGIVKHADSFLSRGSHFFTVVLKNWKIGDISRDTMYKPFFGIASPFDITLLYRGVILPGEGVQSSTKYNLVVAICHVKERYVSLVRNQEKWCLYDIDSVEVFDSWEELLENYREITTRPEVLFFEVIK